MGKILSYVLSQKDVEGFHIYMKDRSVRKPKVIKRVPFKSVNELLHIRARHEWISLLIQWGGFNSALHPSEQTVVATGMNG